MPTSWRNWRRSTLPEPSMCPHTSIDPPLMISRWSRQRSAVLLPEPLWLMMATTSPLWMSNDTPLRTSLSPNFLCTSCTLTIADIQFPFHGPGPARQRVAQAKIQQADQREDQERLEQRIVDDLAGARQFHESHHGCQRCRFDDLHQKPYGGRQRQLDGLRNNDQPQRLPARKA